MKKINDGAGAKSPGVKAGGDPDGSFKGAGANVVTSRLPRDGAPKGHKSK